MMKVLVNFASYTINNEVVNEREFWIAILIETTFLLRSGKVTEHDVDQFVYFVNKFGYSTKLNQLGKNWYCAE
jgi:hypothetical protein